jgi:hypothetical protein
VLHRFEGIGENAPATQAFREPLLSAAAQGNGLPARSFNNE